MIRNPLPDKVFVRNFVGKGALCSFPVFNQNPLIMEFNAKNNFFNLLRQFEMHTDAGNVYYCGVQVQQRGTLEVHLKSAFNSFKQEFENNLMDANARTYIGILQTGLSEMEKELSFQLKENVTAYRLPLTEAEFPDEEERKVANARMKEQYRENQLHLVEQIVNFQLYYIQQCREYIELHSMNSLSAPAVNSETKNQTSDSSTLDIKEEPADLSAPYQQLFFSCSRIELTVLYWLFKKVEFIESGRGDMVSFIQTYCLYKGEDGKPQKMKAINGLISDIENGAKNPEHARKEVIKKLEDALITLKHHIENIKNEVIDKSPSDLIR